MGIDVAVSVRCRDHERQRLVSHDDAAGLGRFADQAHVTFRLEDRRVVVDVDNVNRERHLGDRIDEIGGSNDDQVLLFCFIVEHTGRCHDLWYMIRWTNKICAVK